MTDKDKIEEALRNAPNGVEPRADLADDAAALAQKLYADKPKKTKKNGSSQPSFPVWLRVFSWLCLCPYTIAYSPKSPSYAIIPTSI